MTSRPVEISSPQQGFKVASTGHKEHHRHGVLLRVLGSAELLMVVEDGVVGGHMEVI